MIDLLTRDFASYQAAVESVIAELGGHTFARASVLLHASGLLRDRVRERLGHDGYRNLPSFTEWLLATPGDFARAADDLDRQTGLHSGAPAMLASGPTPYGGRLVLRPTQLTFETVTRTLVFAYAQRDSFASRAKERWVLCLTNEAQAYFAETGLRKPSAAVTHAGSEDGAIKSLRRLADEVFRVPFVDEPTGKAA